ncbi:MAG: FKBP-type peptidyl-prolyl cis-trans isomerase [Bacteroidales bacterium]|nr:FKBP-type peptidyl-prolyl cis-trans isomerase [Bacteroidales bacterium]
MIHSLIIIIIFVLLICSCKEKTRNVSDKDIKELKEPLIEVNKYLVKKDADLIKKYAERRKWKMKETESGLWYMIYKNGNGKQANEGEFATINYTVNLFNGKMCYSSDSLGSKYFKIGNRTVERGLDEGILLLKEGDKAKFILPPHLAYGLLGDDNKIPSRSIIVYDVELLEISNY